MTTQVFRNFITENLAEDRPAYGGIAISEVIEAFAMNSDAHITPGSRQYAELALALMQMTETGYNDRTPTIDGHGSISVLNRVWKANTPVARIVNALRVSIPAYHEYLLPV